MCVVDFGLSMAETLSLSLKEFVSLLDRHNKKQKLTDTRLARLMAVITNAGILSVSPHVKKPPKQVTEKDYLPQPPKPKGRPQTTKQMISMVEIVNAALGGEDRRVKR